MNFLFINFGEGSASHGSGGTERVSQVALHINKEGHPCSFVGTEGLKSFLNLRGINLPVYVIASPRFLKTETSKWKRLFSYFWSSIYITRVRIYENIDVVYSASDFFPDIVAAISLKLRHREKFWVAILHHKAKLKLGGLSNTFFSLLSVFGQRFSWFLISRFANQILVYDTAEGREIARTKTFRDRIVSLVENGIEYDVIARSAPIEESPPLLFIGGPRLSKGIMDLPELLSKLSNTFPGVVCGIAGKGTPETISELNTKLKSRNLFQSIRYLGHLDKVRLYGHIKGAKVVISLSYEEGWGIAIREAMAAGARCVTYDLAAFSDLAPHLDVVPIGDTKAFAEKVLQILHRNELETSEVVRKVGKSWSQVAMEEINIIKSAMFRRTKL